jgi:hypothetical protein
VAVAVAEAGRLDSLRWRTVVLLLITIGRFSRIHETVGKPKLSQHDNKTEEEVEENTNVQSKILKSQTRHTCLGEEV